MNYFERLIRRALLEQPATAGGSLRDPFENEAPHELDTPRGVESRPATLVASANPTAPVTPADIEIKVVKVAPEERPANI